jgi:hypothetical protein
VAAKEDLPVHIKDEPVNKVPRIPLALVEEKYNRKFWKILLHAFLPGTMITPRPAALLAALSLRMGMAPLREAADKELLHWNKWNTLDIPETWNTNCLNLILEADKDYEKRVEEGATTRPALGAAFLQPEDRRLFRTLVDYKMMEMNLGTTLTAKTGWHPEKTKVALGPTVVCKSCHFPRSVTIMDTGGICGLCCKDTCTCPTPEEHNMRVKANVTKEDTKETKITWVECGRTACRAQYVVYNPDKLNVRSKCHYCRNANLGATDMTTPSRAPLVECTQCLNKVIWPEEYRPLGFTVSAFKCPPCEANFATIVGVEVTTSGLAKENGGDWLLRNDDKKIAEPFNGRTLFHTISTAGTDGFADKVEVLPANANLMVFTLRGKLIRNPDEILAELRRWIDSRRAQADTCSLCFGTFKKRDLRQACGRSGCAQRICAACHVGWYGLNARGRTINTAALSCPFCRRLPAPGTVSSYGLGGLGGLRAALEDQSWVWAWCADCGFAKHLVERVCAAGAPPELRSWDCDECRASGGKLVRKAKRCPACKAPTEKAGGCNHIECICGECWCYACGEAIDASQIYDHMETEHGGIYGGQSDEEEEEE